MPSSDIDNLYREIYDETVVELWTHGDTALVNKLMQAPKIQANTRAVLIPRLTAPGGDFKSFTYDGDAYPQGTNITTDKPSLSSIGVILGFSATELMAMASRSDKVSIRNFMDIQVPLMVKTMKNWFECLLNAPSNDGVAARLSGVQNTTEYIMDSTNDRYGGYLLIEGGRYQIFKASDFPATERANGPYRVLPNGGLNKRLIPAIVQFSQAGGASAAAITGFEAEDRVVFRGLANGSINSIGHHVSGSASGTWQGVSRALPFNRSSRINGGGNPLDAAVVRRLHADILKFTGEDANLVPYMSHEQKVNWEASAMSMSRIFLESGNGPGIGEIYDRTQGRDITINKQSPIISNRANPQEFRFLKMDDFRWVTMKDITNIPFVGGGRLHPNYNTSGEELSSYSMYLGYHGNLGAATVHRMGVVDSLLKTTLGE